MSPDQRIIELGKAIHDALQDFVERNPDMLEIYSDNLEGGCAIAAAFLTRAIRNKLRVKASFAANTGHAWVESGGFIYDPTARQFLDFRDGPKVNVMALSDVDEDDPYPYGRLDTRRIFTINSEWPRGQRPNRLRLFWNPNGTATFQMANRIRRAA